jgi:uncharacterized protein
MTFLGLLLGLLVGMTLGLLGGGGSVLTVPIFVYVLGIEKKPAIAMSLAVVGITSLVGAYRHGRSGNVNLKAALIFGTLAMAGGFVGGHLSHYLSGDLQLAIFAGVMFIASLLMFRGRSTPKGYEVPAEPQLLRLAIIAAPAIAVGLLTGLIGVGGGFLIVPALVLLARVPMKQAIGTSLLVIAMTAASGFVGQLTRHVEIRWGFMGAFALAASAGILAGASFVPRIPQETLRKAFAVFLMIMAVLILYENRNIFPGR